MFEVAVRKHLGRRSFLKGVAASAGSAFWAEETLPIIKKGYIKVPDGPGLGITLNEEALKKQLTEPGFFEPTP